MNSSTKEKVTTYFHCEDSEIQFPSCLQKRMGVLDLFFFNIFILKYNCIIFSFPFPHCTPSWVPLTLLPLNPWLLSLQLLCTCVNFATYWICQVLLVVCDFRTDRFKLDNQLRSSSPGKNICPFCSQHSLVLCSSLLRGGYCEISHFHIRKSIGLIFV